MKWLYRHLYRKERGFTLVELMIVIIILAILTGIAVPSYMVLRTRARVQATRAEMLNMATAISLYDADKDTFPVGTTIGALETALETGRYMETCPTKDGWDNAYTYTGTATTYTLTSTGGGTTAISITNGVFVGE